MRFGDKLKNLLEETEMTQKQLAFALGIPASTLGNYIRNDREPDFETLKIIAAYFNVTTDYLLDFMSKNVNNFYEYEILRIFRSLSQEQQELYVEQGRVFVRMNNRKTTKLS